MSHTISFIESTWHDLLESVRSGKLLESLPNQRNWAWWAALAWLTSSFAVLAALAADDEQHRLKKHTKRARRRAGAGRFGSPRQYAKWLLQGALLPDGPPAASPPAAAPPLWSPPPAKPPTALVRSPLPAATPARRVASPAVTTSGSSGSPVKPPATDPLEQQLRARLRDLEAELEGAMQARGLLERQLAAEALLRQEAETKEELVAAALTRAKRDHEQLLGLERARRQHAEAAAQNAAVEAVSRDEREGRPVPPGLAHLLKQRTAELELERRLRQKADEIASAAGRALDELQATTRAHAADLHGQLEQLRREERRLTHENIALRRRLREVEPAAEPPPPTSPQPAASAAELLSSPGVVAAAMAWDASAALVLNQTAGPAPSPRPLRASGCGLPSAAPLPPSFLWGVIDDRPA